MAYTPDPLVIDTWTSPIVIGENDYIANLDDQVNDIVSDDANSMVNHVNTELAKLPNYLSTELESMESELSASSGNWTPTLVGVTNISASAGRAGSYIRVGNIVSFSVELYVSATTADILTEIRVPLPVASNFAWQYDLRATISADSSVTITGAGVGDATNDAMLVRYYPGSTNYIAIMISGTYAVR